MLFFSAARRICVVLCVFVLVVFAPSLAFGAEPGSVADFFERGLTWAEANPVLAVALIGIVWPAITGLASFGYGRLEERFPNAIKALRASGLDIPKTARALVAMLWPKRLPPPPGMLLAWGWVAFLYAAGFFIWAMVIATACGGATNPCVNAYDTAETPEDLKRADEACASLVEGGVGGQGGAGGGS